MKTINSDFKPCLNSNWQLSKFGSNFTIQSKNNQNQRILLEPHEYDIVSSLFDGTNTLKYIQSIIFQKEFGDIDPQKVEELCAILLENNVIDDGKDHLKIMPPQYTLGLREGLEWIPRSNGFYYLRNPFDVTYMEVSEGTKDALLQFGRATYAEIYDDFGWDETDISSIQDALGKLNMLDSAVIYSDKHKFSQESSWNRIPFWNPDQWLEKRIKSIRFIWDKPSKFLIITFLVFTFSVSLSFRQSLSENALKILSSLSIGDIAQFIIYLFSVIAIHELGHGFTLKSYGMKVPAMGLIIGLMPGIYTDTTDAKGLKKPAQRFWVMAAGIVCQAILWAFGFWVWLIAQDGTWLADSAYIFMFASTFSLIINLNPLTKLDGYYLFAAASDIEDLKERSFSLYKNLFSREGVEETEDKILVLLVYAPLSFAYTFYVLGKLFLFLANNAVAKMPTVLIIFLSVFFAFSLFNKGMKNIPILDVSSSKTKSSTHELNQVKTLALKIPAYIRWPARISFRLAKNLVKPALFLALLYAIGNLSLSDSVTGEAIIASSKGSRRMISMPRAGMIEYVADPDASIKAGDVILQISPKEIDEEIEDLRLQKRDAETKVGLLNKRIESVRNNLIYFEQNLQRYQRLADQGAFPAQSVDEVTNQQQNAISQLETFQLEQANAQSLVAALEGKLIRLEADKQELIMISPINGTMIFQDADRLEGATLPRGEQLFEIVDLTELTANVSVRQVYSDLVKVGSNAVFRPMNLASSEYIAEVVSVPSFMDANGDLSKGTSLLVPIMIKNDGNLRINETGYASIEVEPLKLYQMAFREIADVLPIQRIKPLFLGL